MEIYNHVYRGQPLVPILSQMNPFHTVPFYLRFILVFSIIPHLHPCISSDPFLQVSPPEFCMLLSHASHMSFPSNHTVWHVTKCFLGANAGKGRVPNQTLIEILS
jgi:hypothetical protein